MRDWGVFWSEFRRNFHSTGAVLPSGRFLAREMVRQLPRPSSPAFLLEAGPGTGAFTDPLVRSLRPEDRLVLVELNATFVRVLRDRLDHDPKWTPYRKQVEVFHGAIEHYEMESRFDAIVCGLPFNNFTPAITESILSSLMARLQPQGTLGFFEYLGIRRLKNPFVSAAEQQRLREIADVLQRYLTQYRVGSSAVWFNVPPAVVHHLRLSPISVTAGGLSAGSGD